MATSSLQMPFNAKPIVVLHSSRDSDVTGRPKGERTKERIRLL